jgi:hypothetical protein
MMYTVYSIYVKQYKVLLVIISQLVAKQLSFRLLCPQEAHQPRWQRVRVAYLFPLYEEYGCHP